jgi:hypothetical protein
MSNDDPFDMLLAIIGLLAVLLVGYLLINALP